MGSSKKINSMDMECLSIKMAKNIKVGLLKANSMVLALWLIFMGMKLKENIILKSCK